ncbi:MAG: alpha/beta hydrolase [Rudaea sp.]|uniref:alpha/beta hydrolase n=1 Tax=Rudaea sp. TaxID=2136325 RepID=UPI0039E37E40
MDKRNLFRLALLLAVAGAFAWKRFAAAPAAARGAPAAAAIPTNAREFTLGTLAFKACELPQKKSGATTAAFCAPFSVPENPDDPASRRIDLHLALIKSDAERADSDIVVFLAGGPGQAAVETYPQIAAALAPLRRHHHILLLDQRGTGQSHPLDCEAAKDDEKNGTRAGETDSGIDTAKLRETTSKCLAEIEKKADPRQYTTTVATRDLEDLRVALGAPQFDLVGVSYGTRMAQQYLMRHPAGVRSVVLDSVAPNELVFGQEFAQNLDSALKAQFALCSKNAACAKAFGDSWASLGKLRDALRAQPQNVTLRDPVTFKPDELRLSANRFAGLVRMFAYSPETAALLPLSIAEGLKGNYAPLAGQTQLLQDDMSGAMNGGMQASVICSEDADLLKPDPNDANTLLDSSSLTDAIAAMCAVWPHGATPADFHAPLKSDKPILVLEGELDPVTPPRYGEQVMQGLSNAKLIVARGQGHNVIGRGCIPKLVDEFVEKLNPKMLDAKCVDALGPVPALVDFNGASP